MKIDIISPDDVTGSMPDPKCSTCGKTQLADDEKWNVGIVMVNEGTEREWLCPTCARKERGSVNIMIEM